MVVSKAKAFQVRLPADLHSRLDGKAKSLGTSMNKLVEEGVRNVLDGGDVVLLSGDESIDVDKDVVVAALAGDVDALKRGAKHFENLRLFNLSSLLYGLAAERLAPLDRKRASKELVRSALNLNNAPADISIGLFRMAIRLSPENEVAKNLLGQKLYYVGQYSEAVEYLAVVRERDNRARLFHGFASLEIAQETDNKAALDRAGNEIVTALQAWAFGSHDQRERARWLRQVGKLDQSVPEFHKRVDALLEYANDNTSWNAVSRRDLSARSSVRLTEDVGEE